MVFQVVMYSCERWTIRESESWRTDAFELWCQMRLLWVLWTARRSNQPIWKEINSEYSLEWLTLKLKLQYFGHLMQRADSWEEILMLGKKEGKSRWGQQRMKWLGSITNLADMYFNKFWDIVGTEEPGMLQSMGLQRDMTWRLNNSNKYLTTSHHFLSPTQLFFWSLLPCPLTLITVNTFLSDLSSSLGLTLYSLITTEQLQLKLDYGSPYIKTFQRLSLLQVLAETYKSPYYLLIFSPITLPFTHSTRGTLVFLLFLECMRYNSTLY